MFKNVLVATDGSDHANKAVDLAVDMAAKDGAALTVLSVIESGALTENAKRLAREKGIDMSPVPGIPDFVAISPNIEAILPDVGMILANGRIKAELAEAIMEEARDRASVPQGDQYTGAHQKRRCRRGDPQCGRGRGGGPHRHGQPRSRHPQEPVGGQRVADGKPPRELHLHHRKVGCLNSTQGAHAFVNHSPWVDWAEIAAADPEAILVAPCGFTLGGVLDEVPALTGLPGWADLGAVKAGRVAAVRLFSPPQAR